MTTTPTSIETLTMTSTMTNDITGVHARTDACESHGCKPVAKPDPNGDRYAIYDDYQHRYEANQWVDAMISSFAAGIGSATPTAINNLAYLIAETGAGHWPGSGISDTASREQIHAYLERVVTSTEAAYN